MNKSFFSIRRTWTNSASIGIGIGWDECDRTMCVFVMLMFWTVVIGPHIPLEVGENSL